MSSIENNGTCWFCLTAAGLFGAIAVALGAFHAHGLQTHLENTGLTPDVVAKRMDNCETGVRYQMYGALALLGIAALSSSRPITRLIPVGFVLGTVLFSGSLYGIVFLNKTWLGAVAPLGGGTLILSWLSLAVCAIRGQS